MCNKMNWNCVFVFVTFLCFFLFGTFLFSAQVLADADENGVIHDFETEAYPYDLRDAYRISDFEGMEPEELSVGQSVTVPVGEAGDISFYKLTVDVEDDYCLRTVGPIDFDSQVPRLRIYDKRYDEIRNPDGYEPEYIYTEVYRRCCLNRYYESNGCRYVVARLYPGKEYYVMATDHTINHPFQIVVEPYPNEIANEFIKAKKIEITGPSHRIAAGKKVQLKAVVSPLLTDCKAVSWQSSNKKVATVNSKGLVTMKAKSGGKSVTITATAKDGSKVYGSFKIISMKGIVKKLSIRGKSSVKAGKTVKLKVKIAASKGAYKSIKWTCSNTKYATVTSTGLVKAKKAGKGKTVTITVKALDGSGKKASRRIKIK